MRGRGGGEGGLGTISSELVLCVSTAVEKGWHSGHGAPPGQRPPSPHPTAAPKLQESRHPSPALPTPALAPGRAGPAGRGRELGRCNVTFPGHRDDVEFRQTKKRKKKAKKRAGIPGAPSPSSIASGWGNGGCRAGLGGPVPHTRSHTWAHVQCDTCTYRVTPTCTV